MKVLAGETLGQKSPPSSAEWGENRVHPQVPAPSTSRNATSVDDDWDPTFYFPALLVVLTANAVVLWWLVANAI